MPQEITSDIYLQGQLGICIVQSKVEPHYIPSPAATSPLQPTVLHTFICLTQSSYFADSANSKWNTCSKVPLCVITPPSYYSYVSYLCMHMCDVCAAMFDVCAAMCDVCAAICGHEALECFFLYL